MALKAKIGQPSAENGHGTVLRVTCQANRFIDLDEIHPLQGDLKELDEPSFAKLRESIINYGISFPFFIWQDKKKTYCLDGHQRDIVLHRLREEGYTIPPLPADLIEAKDKDEAKEKLLIASSLYGRVTESGLWDFLEGTKANMERILGTVNIPQIDLAGFLKAQTDPDAPKDFKSYDENLHTDLKCPKCGYEFSGKSRA